MGMAIVLVDCQNFYANCERVFDPFLRHKPVAVLPDNDGCVIARSEEAKEMGTPHFKARGLFDHIGAQVFSSNYSLYGDMPRRVRAVLRRFAIRLEAYSIDECFLTLPRVERARLRTLFPHHVAAISMDTFLRLRRSFERLAPMPDAVWERVQQAWQLSQVRRGEVLTREGDTEKTFSLVLEGVQRLYFRAPGGEDEVTVAFAYPYDYSGVPDSFFLQTPSAYTLEALTDGRLLSVSHEDLTALMDQHRELDRWAWRLLAATMSARAKRERRLLTMSAKERYERLLRESPQLLQLAPLKHVASYLGMSPETLSRARAEAS